MRPFKCLLGRTVMQQTLNLRDVGSTPSAGTSFKCSNKSTRRPDALNVHISGQFRVGVPFQALNHTFRISRPVCLPSGEETLVQIQQGQSWFNATIYRMNALRGDVVLVSSPARTLRTLFIEQLVRRLQMRVWRNLAVRGSLRGYWEIIVPWRFKSSHPHQFTTMLV